MSSPASLSRRSFLRAALAGLGVGLLAGALFLLVSGLRGQGIECPELPLDECLLRQQTAREVGRYQLLFSVGLALAAVALFLLLRGPRRPSAAG